MTRKTTATDPRYCLQCDDGTVLEFDTRTVSETIKDEPFRVEGVTGWHCPVCGEIEFNTSHDAARVSAARRAAYARANEREAQALRAQRKKLKLTQADAAKLTGGGHNAFSRYERGETTPSPAVINLFKLLAEHPELLAEIRVNSPQAAA